MELKFSSPNAAIVVFAVLIVPYGIEILPFAGEKVQLSVLIVPYGIEIRYRTTRENAPGCINCTLWN